MWAQRRCSPSAVRLASYSDRRRGSRGFTLIDVLLVIVLLGIVSGALMTLSGRLATQSAETAKIRQAIAVAQALLEEVRHMPFTYCDPTDSNAALATSATIGGAGCATTVDAMGPEPGESRYNAANRFNGVSDYHLFTMPAGPCAGLCDIAGNLINGAGSPLTGCSARVVLAAQALPGIAALDVNGRPQALLISVSVACPGVTPLVLQGIRVRHAPNSF